MSHFDVVNKNLKHNGFGTEEQFREWAGANPDRTWAVVDIVGETAYVKNGNGEYARIRRSQVNPRRLARYEELVVRNGADYNPATVMPLAKKRSHSPKPASNQHRPRSQSPRPRSKTPQRPKSSSKDQVSAQEPADQASASDSATPPAPQGQQRQARPRSKSPSPRKVHSAPAAHSRRVKIGGVDVNLSPADFIAITAAFKAADFTPEQFATLSTIGPLAPAQLPQDMALRQSVLVVPRGGRNGRGTHCAIETRYYALRDERFDAYDADMKFGGIVADANHEVTRYTTPVAAARLARGPIITVDVKSDAITDRGYDGKYGEAWIADDPRVRLIDPDNNNGAFHIRKNTQRPAKVTADKVPVTNIDKVTDA